MAFLRITVVSPVGVFDGFSNLRSENESDIIKTRDILQSRIDTLKTMTLFPNLKEPESKQITFPGTILKNSVITFDIVE